MNIVTILVYLISCCEGFSLIGALAICVAFARFEDLNTSINKTAILYTTMSIIMRYVFESVLKFLLKKGGEDE